MLLSIFPQLLALTVPTPTQRTVLFPKSVLARFLADSDKAVPGTRVESPPFEACGCNWQIALYPFGGNADASFAGRVGVYLKLLEQEEVDATFALRLQILPNDEATDEAARDAATRGLTFRCGMTFCSASEAGETVGRCEDWGAHVYPTNLLLRELEVQESSVCAVDVELSVWEQRPCKTGASLLALANQVRRLPTGALRVGEVVVALPGSLGASRQSPESYEPLPGVEYRVMRLMSADGEARFESGSGDVATAFLLPTSKAARAAGRFDSNEGEYREKYAGAAASGAVDIVDEGEQRSSTSLLPKDASWGGTEVSWSAEGGPITWPAPVPMAELPPLASRLGFRALPARLLFQARTSTRVLLLFLLIGASPLWGGAALSQLGSAYAIPSRSMEATLRVGDVVLAERLSRLAQLPFEPGDLVLFSPPETLQKKVRDAGGSLGSRDLFVKRVAAVGGDVVELLPSGGIAVNGQPRTPPPLACEGEGDGRNGRDGGAPLPSGGAPPPSGDEAPALKSRVIPSGSLFVLGDCPERSTDSRAWGPLPEENVVARPFVRIWPPARQGAIDETVDLNPFRRAMESREER